MAEGGGVMARSDGVPTCDPDAYWGWLCPCGGEIAYGVAQDSGLYRCKGCGRVWRLEAVDLAHGEQRYSWTATKWKSHKMKAEVK